MDIFFSYIFFFIMFDLLLVKWSRTNSSAFISSFINFRIPIIALSVEGIKPTNKTTFTMQITEKNGCIPFYLYGIKPTPSCETTVLQLRSFVFKYYVYKFKRFF